MSAAWFNLTSDVEVFFIVLVDHARCNVRTVLASITFTGDEYFPVVQIKEIHEVLPEWQELLDDIGFAGGVGLACL